MLPAPGGGPGMNPSSPLLEEREFTINHYKDVIRLAHSIIMKSHEAASVQIPLD